MNLFKFLHQFIRRTWEYIFPCSPNELMFQVFDFNKKTNSLHALKIICLSFFLFAFSNNALSSDPREEYLRSEIKENTFNNNTWKDAIEGIDYSREVEKKKKEQEEAPEPDEEEEDDRIYEDVEVQEPVQWGSFMTRLFQILLLLIGVVVIGFVIANVIGAEGFTGRPSNKKIKNTTGAITLDNVEENIHESDLDNFLREALTQGDYTQAVRLYYLAIIKELSLNKWIKWKKDKTNRDYSRELSGSNFQNPFREITRIFERVWYGNNTLTSSDFNESLQPKLKQLLDLVKQTGRKL